jgi:hypothetical protein
MINIIMARINKFFNNHIILLCTAIVATSLVALLFVNTETFYNSVASSSILSPEFDFNAKLKSLAASQKKSQAVVREDLLLKLANEHIPIIMCSFYDLVTGPKRLLKPDNVDEGRWLQQLWAEFMEGMGIPATVYMSIMELRYSWFTETRDTFESFQAKLEPSFVKATLERYIQSNGNFVPTSTDKYKQALQCKMYRVFSKSASLLNYMGTTTQQPSQQSTTTNANTQQSSATNANTQQQQPSTQQNTETKKDDTKKSDATKDTSTTDSKDKTTEPEKPKEATPLLKWVVPSNFTAMCLEKGNRLQCFLMSILFVISIVCIVAIIITLVAPLFNKQTQTQF